MSTTALVRSSSSSNSLTVQKPATPSTTSSIAIPKLNLTPQQNVTPFRTPTGSSLSAQPQPLEQQQQQQTPASAPKQNVGRWQHPRLNEVISRRSATQFDASNVRSITMNFVALILSYYIPTFLSPSLAKQIDPYYIYTLYPLRILFLTLALIPFLPLLRKPDACEDIPLTPAQRSRLGLPPMSRPATPAEEAQYVTPPRFSRTGTPRGSGSGSSSVRVNASGSPGVGSGSPLSPFPSVGGQQRRRSSGSPLTPSGSGIAGGRRSSFGLRSSPLGGAAGFGGSEFDVSGTPTKVVGNPRASVGLNNKWLYEKGRASPSSGSGSGAQSGFMGGSGWGTGSVFS